MEHSNLPRPVTDKSSYHHEQPGLEVAPDQRPDTGLEVAPDTGLHVYQPERDAKEPVLAGTYPPGVYTHDAYPEVYYGDHQAGGGPALPAGSTPEKARRWSRKWLIIGGIALVVIIAAIVGGVVGSRNNRSEQVESGEASEATAAPSSSAISSSTAVSSSAAPTATSILRNSALSAISFRTAPDGTPAGVSDGFVIVLLYKDPTGQLVASVLRDLTKEDEEDKNKWQLIPIALEPPTPVQNNTGLAMAGHSTVSVGKRADGSDRLDYKLHLLVYYISDTGKVNGLDYDYLAALDPLKPLQINDRKFNVRTGSRVAAYWPWVAFQDMSGFIQMSNSLATTPYSNTQLLKQIGMPGTHLSIVPVSNDHEKIIDSSYGIFYQESQNGLLTPALPGNLTGGSGVITQSWAPISKFPKIALPNQGSFAAFSNARSQNKLESDLVNTFVLYQDNSSEIRQVWTDDSETWKQSSPAALKKADLGTDITCLTPASSNSTFSPALYVAPQSKLTRCYFQREGWVIEVQQNGTDWTELGILPIT